MNKKLSWEEVKRLYEEKKQKSNKELIIGDLNTPELVLKYIEKYELDSSSAEIIFNKHIKKMVVRND